MCIRFQGGLEILHTEGRDSASISAQCVPSFACCRGRQAHVQMKADVYVKSSYLDAEAVERAMLRYCASVEETVAELLDRYGSEATICVLPEGPMTIPYVVGD